MCRPPMICSFLYSNTFPIISILVIFIWWPLATSHAQTSNTLFQPSYYDWPHEFQLQPDGDVRILAKSRQARALQEINYSGGGFAVTRMDIPFGTSLLQIQVQDVDSLPIYLPDGGDSLRNYVGQLITIPLYDGSTILAVDGFDCDFGFGGGICRMDNNGNMMWSIPNEHVISNFNKIVFVDSNTVVLDMYGDDVFFDLDGTVHQHSSPVPFTFTAQTEFGFIAAINDQLILLDTDFNAFLSFTIDAKIFSLEHIGDKAFLVTSEASKYILHGSVILEQLPQALNEEAIIWYANPFYYSISNETRQFSKYNSSFEIIKQETIPSQWNAYAGAFHHGKTYVAGTYETNYTESIVFLKSENDSLTTRLPNDIGVTDISIHQPVYRASADEFFMGRWQYFFDSLSVEITNFGLDTVYSCKIEAQYQLHCDWCPHEKAIWHLDSILMPPGRSLTYEISSYLPSCVFGDKTSLCITTLAPNSKGDGDVFSDEYCETFNVLTLSDEETKYIQEVGIQPNPVNRNDGEFRILNVHSVYDLQIYSGDGKLIWKANNQLPDSSIPTEGLSPGVYFIKIISSGDQHSMQKLIVQ